MKLGDPMGPGVIHDLEGNPFGPSTFFAFQGGIIIEVIVIILNTNRLVKTREFVL